MSTFLSTTGTGLARAEKLEEGRWSVELLLKEQEVTCLAADPSRAGVVYAGTQGQGLFCSEDNGKTWSPAGLAGQVVKAVGASPAKPGVIYAGTKPARMYVSMDHGQHWRELAAFRKIFSRRFWFSPAEPPFSAYVQGIACSPTDPNTVVVGIEAGAVVRTTDGGMTWEDHRRGALRDCHTITFHQNQGSWVYEAGGTGAGVAVSRDAGRTWQQPGTGLDRHYGWACAADPLQPEIWYASVSPSPMKAHGSGSAEAFIYRASPDGGWEKLSGGLLQPLDSMPYALLTDPSKPGSIYAGLNSGDVWYSHNYGDTWQQMPFNLRSIHRCLVMLP